MEVNDEIAKLIIKRVVANVIRDKALEQGMTLLATDGVRAIKEGLTSIDEVISVSYIEEAEEDTFTIEEGETEEKAEETGEK